MHHDLLCHRESLASISEEVNVAESVMSMVEEHNALLTLARLRGRQSPTQATTLNNASKRSCTRHVS
jgi:hypothetical protein